MSGKRSTYVGVYCEKCKKKKIVDMVFLDFDNKDLDLAYEAARKILTLFPASINFTGKGGFA